jgi:diguanylate cyclase (GGDEF)-like protein
MDSSPSARIARLPGRRGRRLKLTSTSADIPVMGTPGPVMGTSMPPTRPPRWTRWLLPARLRPGLATADFSDDAEMAGVRARTCAVLALFAFLSGLLDRVLAPDTVRAPHRVELAVGAMLVLVGWTLVRGRRMGDGEFLAYLLCSDLGLVVFASGTRLDVIRSSPELALLLPSLIAAVFAQRRVIVVLHTLGVLAATVFVIWLRVDDLQFGIQAVLFDGYLVVSVTLVVRLLRDLARQAVELAKHGEVTDPPRRRVPITFLVIDVDHFKRVNDTLGHPAGDDMLRRVSQLLTDVIREDDIAVRLGGEEFLVLAKVSGAQARELAERLRTDVERELPITISVGVHTALPDQDDALPDSLWQAVADADRALYSAKRAGRNQVVCSAGTS